MKNYLEKIKKSERQTDDGEPTQRLANNRRLLSNLGQKERVKNVVLQDPGAGVPVRAGTIKEIQSLSWIIQIERRGILLFFLSSCPPFFTLVPPIISQT